MLRTRVLIVVGLSCMALTACKDARDYVREKYTGERVSDPVPGPRRVPELNAGSSKSRPAPAVTRPAVAAAPQAASSATTSYEQYDKNGNDTTRKNYLKSWFGSKPEPAQEAPVQTLQPRSQPATPMRKRFSGIVAPQTTVPSVDSTQVSTEVSISPDAVSATAAAPARAVVAAPALISAPEIPGAVPVVNELVPVPLPEDNSVIVPDVPQRSDMLGRSKIAALQPAAGGEDSAEVHLSTVPKTPVQFRELRDSKMVYEKELKNGRDQAVEQKRLLQEEPTEFKPAMPLPENEGRRGDPSAVQQGV